MSYESYCAACTYLGENADSYGKYYCRYKGDRYASDPKCGLYIEAYSRSSGARENMYDNSRSHKYYITTAILNALKFPDNNYYLKTIGTFINVTLKQNMKYYPLLFAYEIIGPEIAKRLNEDENKSDVATLMFKQYITPTIIAIENNKTEDAVNIYKNMTIELAKKYEVDLNIIVPDPEQISIIELGQGRTKKRIFQEPTIKFI